VELMSDKITLDRETFKVLAADTRVDILKRLAEHKLTLTDLAEQMSMSPSTIKEHLDRLVEVGLIEQMDRGMKWKYYRLTSKGMNILSPNETSVWILLGTSALVLAGSALSIFWRMTGPAVKSVQTLSGAAPPMPEGELMYAAREALNESAGVAALKAADYAANGAEEAADEAASLMAGAPTTTLAGEAVEALRHTAAGADAGAGVAASLPLAEIVLLVLSLAAMGYCVGYLMKKRVKIV